MREIVILVVNQQPMYPDLHTQATLRNLHVQPSESELIVQANANDTTTLVTVATMSARWRGFEADLSKVKCTPYSSSDGISGVAVTLIAPF